MRSYLSCLRLIWSSFDLTNTAGSPPLVRYANSPSLELKITLWRHTQHTTCVTNPCCFPWPSSIPFLIYKHSLELIFMHSLSFRQNRASCSVACVDAFQCLHLTCGLITICAKVLQWVTWLVSLRLWPWACGCESCCSSTSLTSWNKSLYPRWASPSAAPRCPRQ